MTFILQAREHNAMMWNDVVMVHIFNTSKQQRKGIFEN